MSTAEAKRLSEAVKANSASTSAQATAATPPAAAKRRPFAVLAVIVVLGLGGAAAYSLATAEQRSTDDAQVEADAQPLSARVQGTVRKLYVADNQAVKRGDIVLEIDDSDLQVRLSQAKAELAVAQAQAEAASAQEQVVGATATGGLHSAKAQVTSSVVGVQSADTQIEIARAALLRAQTDARRAELDLQRARELRAQNAIAQDRFDSAQLTYDSAQAALTQARGTLAATQDARAGALSRVADAQGRLAASTPTDALMAAAHAQTQLAQAHVKSAQAAVDLAQLELSYAQVKAPQDGIISKLGVREGQLLSENQPVAVLVPSATYVIANFKETQIGDMRVGDRAEVALDAYPGKHFSATVQSLAGGTGARFSLLPPDNASGNFVKVVQRVPVRLSWQAPPNVALQAGLSADVTVTVH